MKRILVLFGPNLNLLGKREPAIYGKQTYADLVAYIKTVFIPLGFAGTFVQSNHEGTLIDEIQKADGLYDGIILNPAAYTHTSIAIADALKAVEIPTVEVHLTDTNTREAFRKISYIRPCCIATIQGLGFAGYKQAAEVLFSHLNTPQS